MASPGVALESPRPSAGNASGYVRVVREAVRRPDPADRLLGELDRKLVALCRERGALRSVLARIAARLVIVRAAERIGYARLSDYAVECLGLPGRSLRSLAEVGAKFRDFPGLERALVSGTLGWTKVRLLARLPRGEDEARWIAHARVVTAEELSREVRAVDRGSIEAGAAEEEGARSRCFEVRCTPEVRFKWRGARQAASRVAGRALHISEAAELIAAEVLSALPIEEDAQDRACEDTGASWRQETDSSRDAASVERSPWRANRADTERSDGGGADTVRPAPWLARPSLPPELEQLIEGLEDDDGFGLDMRFRRAFSLAQCLDARMGALLAQAWSGFVHRALGYSSREAYARERLGMDPTRARALVRLERAALASAPFARAYRSGSLSWVKAAALVPLVNADPLGHFVEDWIEWAGRVTVRRLREDVEHALALAEIDPVAFRRGGGLPDEARRGTAPGQATREIGATARDAREDRKGGEARGGDVEEKGDREIGAAAMVLREHRSRVDDGALNGFLPERFPQAVYMAGRPLPPDDARILARDADGRPALFQIGAAHLGFAGHPGAKVGMIEDLAMEFDEAPADLADGLDALRAAQRAIADALVPIMTGLVQVTGLMRPR